MVEETRRPTARNRLSSSRNYRPQYGAKKFELPAIESFTLEHILNVTLKEESQLVVDLILNVTSKYQDDLRLEIKRKLSTEQKIQFKNIEIAKKAHSINKSLENKQRTLKRAISETCGESIDVSINELLNTTIIASDKCRSIMEKLARIDQLVNDSQNTLQNPNSLNREAYPNLYKLFHPQLHEPEPSNVNRDSEDGDLQVRNLQDITEQAIKEKQHKESVINIQTDDHNDENTRSPIANGSIQITSSRDKMNIDKHEPRMDASNVQSGNVEFIAISKESHIRTDINCSSTKLNEDNSPTLPRTPQNCQAERISSTQSLYRTPELKLRQDVTPGFECPPNEEEFELYISESIAKYRQLRYKSYDDTDPFKDTNLFELSVHDKNSRKPISNSMTTNNPINLLYSSLLSNPKYIDASPINGINPFSSMLSIKSNPTIKLTLQTSHHKKLRINGAPITSESKVATFSNICDSKPHDSDYNAAESLAKRSLSGNLEGVKINSDEELWSSGVNTETEDDDIQYSIDNVIESSSSSDEDATQDDTSTNVRSRKDISSNLSEDQKLRIAEIQKKKKHKRKKRLKQLKKIKESSPSPKFKPSHHTLKPKRSILKVNSTPVPKKQPSIQSFEFEFDECSALSEVNTAFDRKIKSSISEFNALGTIVGIGDEDTNSNVGMNHDIKTRRRDMTDDTNDHGTKSIYKLKDLLISK